MWGYLTVEIFWGHPDNDITWSSSVCMEHTNTAPTSNPTSRLLHWSVGFHDFPATLFVCRMRGSVDRWCGHRLPPPPTLPKKVLQWAGPGKDAEPCSPDCHFENVFSASPTNNHTRYHCNVEMVTFDRNDTVGLRRVWRARGAETCTPAHGKHCNADSAARCRWEHGAHFAQGATRFAPALFLPDPAPITLYCDLNIQSEQCNWMICAWRPCLVRSQRVLPFKHPNTPRIHFALQCYFPLIIPNATFSSSKYHHRLNNLTIMHVYIRWNRNSIWITHIHNYCFTGLTCGAMLKTQKQEAYAQYFASHPWLMDTFLRICYS